MMNNYGNKWKQRLRAGEFLLGGHIFFPNPSIAEAMVCYGYEYLWIDGEHGHFDKAQILSHIMAVNGAGGGVFVRPTSGDPMVLKPILEMGPDGIIMPMCNSPGDAAKFVAACSYPPKGTRGFGPRRANRYGVIGDREYLEGVDDSLVKIIQIEHQAAADCIEEILSVPGIDSVAVGPYDFSGSMGLLGQLRHPKVLEKIEKVIAACKAKKIPCGASIGPADQDYIKYWIDRKVDFLFCGDELSFTKMGAEAAIAKVRSMV
jgi:2-dehydro-3-deoxyglucarate aldolase/4-hydroxy-2-oxoheptanedioate aldolase